MMRGCLLGALLLAGCAATDPNFATRPFELDDLAKSETDLVSETHLRNSLQLLRELMLKLYRRNPVQLDRSRWQTPEQAVAALFDAPGGLLQNRQVDTAAFLDQLSRAFSDDFRGDRVRAFCSGLGLMLLEAYNGDREIYFFEQIDPQKLHHAARNLEIASWKLRTARDAEGRFYLISNEVHGAVPNLSFERLFGKLIALQDNLAEIAADATNRQIRFAIKSAISWGTSAFIPL